MKKIFYYSLFLTQILLLSACTLSMEEYIVTEDQQGIEEPHTVVTPYGEATYKYRANVLPLNGEPQEYIATMNDSVIWFTDNIPDKWIPVEGQYIAANCSRTIPLGLCAKVVSVIRQAGMIRVEHDPAEQDEVFEELAMKLDFGYVVPNLGTPGDTTRAVTRSGFFKNDSVFVDMSLWDRMEQGLTRADGEVGDDEDDGDGLKKEETAWNFNKTFGVGNSQNIYVEIGYKSVDVVYLHHLSDSKRDYKEEWQDSYTEREIEVLVGYGTDKSSASKQLVGTPKSLLEARNMVQAIRAVALANDLRKIDEEIKTISPTISIPSFPLSVIFEAEISAGFDLMIYGKAKAVMRTQPRRTGYIYDGTKSEPKKKIEHDIDIPGAKPYFRFDNIQLGGSADFWLRGRIGFGLLFGNNAGGVGGILGAELKGGFKASLETESLNDFLIVDRQNFKAGFYATLSGYGKGVAKLGPLTFTLGDFNFNTVQLLPDNLMQNLKAEVDAKKTKAKVDAISEEFVMTDENGDPIYIDGEPVMDTRYVLGLNASLNFKKLESFFICPDMQKSDQRAMLRIYQDKIESDKYVDLYGPDAPLEADKTYSFKCNFEKEGLSTKAQEYLVVPCIYDKRYGTVTEYRNNIITANSGVPNIKQPKVYFNYGKDIDVITWDLYYKDKLSEGGILNPKIEDYAEYSFSTVMELKNATNISEWGLIYELQAPYDGKKYVSEQKVPFEGPCRSGKYTIITKFIANSKPTKAVDGFSIRVKPYWVYSGAREEGVYSISGQMYYGYERKGGPVEEGVVGNMEL